MSYFTPEGVFQYEESDLSTPDGQFSELINYALREIAKLIKAGAGAKVTPSLINVKDPAFGAKGDGSADDTDAINRAIDKALTSSPPNAFGDVSMAVHFPAGRYLYSGSRVLPSRVRLQGDGPQVSILYRPSGAGGDMFTLRGASSMIENLSIDGSFSNPATGDGIVLDAAYAVVRNVLVTKQNGNGITVGKTQNALAYRIEGALARLCRGYGVHVVEGSGSTDGMIDNTDVGQCFLSGFKLSNGAQNLTNCHSWGNGIGGVTGDQHGYWVNSTANYFTNCQAETNLGHGFYNGSAGADNNHFTGCHSWANVGAGYYNYLGKFCTWTGGALYRNGVANVSGSTSYVFAAVVLEGTTECSVTGAQMWDDGKAVVAGSGYPGQVPAPFPGRSATFTQSYHVAEVTGADANVFSGNAMNRQRTRTGIAYFRMTDSGKASRWDGNLGVYTAAPTIASAQTIFVPGATDLAQISSTVAIDTITSSWIGRTITLRWLVAGGTVTTAGNVDLASPFTATGTGSLLSLQFDGDKWRELRRVTR